MSEGMLTQIFNELEELENEMGKNLVIIKILYWYQSDPVLLFLVRHDGYSAKPWFK